MNHILKVFVVALILSNLTAQASLVNEKDNEPVKNKPLFVPMTVTPDGSLGFISGQLPMVDGQMPEKFKGKVMKDVSMPVAQEAAEVCANNIHNIIKKHCDAKHVSAVILYVSGMVNGEDGFSEPHVVINGASQYLNRYFAPHARQAVTYSGIPFNACAEVAAIVAFIPNLRASL